MSAEADQLSFLKDIRLLVVEDDELTLRGVLAILKPLAGEVLVARDGQEGLFVFARSRPDILFTDVIMPRMDGLSLVKAAREIRPDIPVMLATSFENSELLKQAISLRVDEYLDKPLSPDELVTAVARQGQRVIRHREDASCQRLQELMLSGLPFPAVLADTRSMTLLSVNTPAAQLGMAAGSPCVGPFFPPEVRDILAQVEVRYYGAAHERGMDLEALDRCWSLSWTPVAPRTVLFLAMDVTERRRAEAELRRAKEDYQSILDNAPVGVYRSTPDGRYLLANIRLARMYGYDSPEELMASVTDIATQLYVDPGGREEFIRRLSDEGWLERHEIQARCKDGSSIWTAHSTRTVRDPGGNILYYEGFVRDITRFKALESLKEDVDRVMRHDLKTPLNAVIGFSHLLTEDPGLSPDQKDMARLVREAGYRMLDMINLSLDLYKMETGTYRACPAPLDLVEVARRILAEMREMIEAQDVEIVLLDGGAPMAPGFACTGLGEDLLCYTMLANLLKNAVEASSVRGRVEVSFRRAGGWASVAVHNQGAVPPQMRAVFFEKYTTHGKAKGTGLGTYSARLIARTQGGDVTMATSEEQGTTVTVTLPDAEGFVFD
jgi:PAS domain S-box-containing protein